MASLSSVTNATITRGISARAAPFIGAGHGPVVVAAIDLNRQVSTPGRVCKIHWPARPPQIAMGSRLFYGDPHSSDRLLFACRWAIQ